MPGQMYIKVQALAQNYSYGDDWTDLTSDRYDVKISGIGLSGDFNSEAREPNPSSAVITLVNTSGAYSINEADSGQIEIGNRIRVLGYSNLYGNLMRVTELGSGSAVGTFQFQQDVTRSIGITQTWTLTWWARAAFDSRNNTDIVNIITSSETPAGAALTYTNKWKQYSYSFTTTLTATTISAVFYPKGLDWTGSGNGTYQYIEYKNISLTCPSVNSGKDILTNGSFTGSTVAPWYSTYSFPTNALNLTLDTDYDILFNGTIEDVQPGPFANGSRKTVLMCDDLLARHGRPQVKTPVQTNVTGDQLMRTLLSNLGTNPQAAYQYVVRRNGPRRWVMLSEAANSTTVADSGVEGVTGTVVGGVTFGTTSLLSNGDTRTCATFNGSTGVINLPVQEYAGKNFSIEFMMRAAASPPGVQTVFSINGSGVGGTHLAIAFFVYSDGHVNFSFNNDDLVTGAGTLSGFGTNKYLITLTYDATSNTATIYVNGSQVAQGTKGPMIGTSPTIQIGALNSAFYYKGDLEDVQFHDYCMTSTQAGNNYAATLFDRALQKVWFPGVALETGKTTFGSAFDGYLSNENTVQTAFRDIAFSEHGYIWIDRDGTLQFKNREWLARQIYAFSLVAGSQSLTNAAYDFAVSRRSDRIINSIILKYTPRQLGGSLTTIGKLASAEQVPGIVSGSYGSTGAIPGERKITVRMVDAVGNPIGGTLVQIPVRGTDWKVAEQGDGTGVDYTSGTLAQYFDLALYSTGPSEATFLARNWATGPLQVWTLNLSGKPIYSYNPVLINRQDLTSIKKYGERPIAREFPFTTDNTIIQAIGDFLLALYANPSTEIGRIQIDNSAQIGTVDLLTLNVGDILNLGDPYAFTNSTKYYHMIVGIDYHFWNDGSTIAYKLARLNLTNITIWDSGAKWDSGPVWWL